MNFPFDPAAPDFAAQVSQLPGFPNGDSFRIQALIFEANAAERLPECLTNIGAKPDAPLLLVVDETVIRRDGEPSNRGCSTYLHKRAGRREQLCCKPKPGEPLHTDTHQVGTRPVPSFPHCRRRRARFGNCYGRVKTRLLFV